MNGLDFSWLNQVQLVHPWAIWLLLLLPVLAYLRGLGGQDAAVKYSSLSLFGQLALPRLISAGGVQSALRFFALIFFIIALARPQQVNATSQIQESGIDMMLAIDLSPSMRALDYMKDGQEISRVEIVRETVKQFIQDRPNDRIGIVAFAGLAYLVSPLTLDHNWLQLNVDRLDVGLTGDATAIGSGIVVCTNRLREQSAKSKVIVLLTDGANNAGKITPLAAAQAAAALGIKVYTIGAGSDHMAKFPITNPFGQVVGYTTIPVDMDENALQQIADLTGGKFYRAKDTNSLQKVYTEINQLEKTRFETKTYRHVKELFAWALWPGLLFLGLEVVLAHTRWRRLP